MPLPPHFSGYLQKKIHGFSVFATHHTLLNMQFATQNEIRYFTFYTTLKTKMFPSNYKTDGICQNAFYNNN